MASISQLFLNLFLPLQAKSKDQPEVYLFGTSSQVHSSELVIVKHDDSNQEYAMPLKEFLTEDRGTSWYLVKLPLAVPPTPLSHSLYSQAVSNILAEMSLSEIYTTIEPLANDSTGFEASSEYFKWSLMDHVIGYPYFHPNGYVDGTSEFQQWHISIMKQYALLLIQRQNNRSDVRALRDKLLMFMDANSITGLDTAKETKNKLQQAEQRHRATIRKLEQFRAEQRMLQKAFRQAAALCLLSTKESQRSKVTNPITPPDRKKYSGRLVILPLNKSHKRKAERKAVCRSSPRYLEGYVFKKAEKKRQKTHQIATETLDAGYFNRLSCLWSNDIKSQSDINGSGNRQDAPSGNEWEIIGGEAPSFEGTPPRKETTPLASPHANNKSLNDSASTFSSPKTRSTTSNQELLDGLSIDKSTFEKIGNDIEAILQREPCSEIISEIDQVVVEMMEEVNKIKAARDIIKEAVQQQSSDQNTLSASGVATLIPVEGIQYTDLVDKLADRVPDTAAGMAILRELVEEVGFVDEATSYVFLRGEVEFSELLED